MADDVRFAPHNPQLMNFYFAVLQWLRIAEHWGDEYRLELLRGEGPQGLLLRLNCLDPSRLLSNSHKRSHALVVFSATLSPQSWMGQLLGLNETAVYRRMTSPFEPAQLDVVVETAIDTRYRQREASAPQLAERLSAFLAEAKGNSIIYFPSYRYLRTTLELMQGSGSALPDRLLWQQHPEQTEADRASLFTAL